MEAATHLAEGPSGMLSADTSLGAAVQIMSSKEHIEIKAEVDEIPQVVAGLQDKVVVTQKTMKEGFSDIKSAMQQNMTLIANVLEKQQQNNVYQQRSQNPMKSSSGPMPSHQYQNQAP
jgi:hypothetical protein